MKLERMLHEITPHLPVCLERVRLFIYLFFIIELAGGGGLVDRTVSCWSIVSCHSR